MKSLKPFLSLFVFSVFFNVQAELIKFIPIEHASFIIKSDSATIFVDPVGDDAKYEGYSPDLILITHKHQDHLKESLLKKYISDETIILAPASVVKMSGLGEVIKNGESKIVGTITVEAIPMYNTTKERLKYHPKADGNGYVLTVNGKRIYIAGDTEDISEMRKLKNIDHAFICMNLPYTMTVEQAVSATLEFKPKVAYPYHYRGKGGMSDVQKYKAEVESKGFTKVEILKWY